MNTRQVCYQIADADLLGSELTRRIKGGGEVDLDQVVAALVYAARDAYAATTNDPEVTWQEKRQATGSLLNAFLTVLLLAKTGQK